MITIRVTGGIGNQLFQYALGYVLEQQLKKQVVYDLSFFDESNPYRGNRALEIEIFELDNFNKTVGLGLKTNLFSKLKRAIERKFYPYFKQSYIKEVEIGFDANILKCKADVCLDGCWQSPKYFESVEENLHKQFVLKNELSACAGNFSELIKNADNSISLHIRRGDYITQFSDQYCIQDQDYYTNAIRYIKNEIKSEDVTLFVFSDDIEWCKQHLAYTDKTVFVNSEGCYAYEDMILIAKCNHNIIANSSYSWWGGWLNKNPRKIVIGPKNWFRDTKKNNVFINDIYPASWKVM